MSVEECKEAWGLQSDQKQKVGPGDNQGDNQDNLRDSCLFWLQASLASGELSKWPAITTVIYSWWQDHCHTHNDNQKDHHHNSDYDDGENDEEEEERAHYPILIWSNYDQGYAIA